MYKSLDNEDVSDETSTDADRTEASDLSSAPISDSYGSTPAQDTSDPQFCVPCCAVIFYVMAYFGFFCSLLLREGLSVAIVAMVNQTAIAEEYAMIMPLKINVPDNQNSNLKAGNSTGTEMNRESCWRPSTLDMESLRYAKATPHII